MKYVFPETNKKSFTCPYCNVLATQCWSEAYVLKNGGITTMCNSQDDFRNKIQISKCDNCEQLHFWIDENMVIPSESKVPLPNEHMPKEVKDLYNEAREVLPKSPKSTAALLRLALQYLCIELGCKGKNINDDIARLVENGLPVQVQKSLDIIRVTGNNAVHPGTMDLGDDNQIAAKLFELLNFIVDRMIVQPKEIENLFNGLPEGTLDAIEKRDKVNA